MNENLKRLTDLMRIDLINMTGKGNSIRNMGILMTLFLLGVGFFITPVMAVLAPITIGAFLSESLLAIESRYNSERMFALLPVSRHDLVKSRFIMIGVLNTVICFVYWLLMTLSIALKLYQSFSTPETDILYLFAQKSGGIFTEQGLFNLLYLAAFSFGNVAWSYSIKGRMTAKDRPKAGMEFRKPSPREAVQIILLFAAIMLFVLLVTGFIPIGGVGVLVIQLITQLAMAAGGLLLGPVLLVISLMEVGLNYVQAQLRYEDKEL